MSKLFEKVRVSYTRIITSTSLAILYEIGGVNVWLPKKKTTTRYDECVVIMPRWLAKKEGLR